MVGDVTRYLESIYNSGVGIGSSIQPAIDTLEFAACVGHRQSVDMRKLGNNTKAKKRAASSHNKLDKLASQRSRNQQLQRRALATTNPRKIYPTMDGPFSVVMAT